MNPFESLMRAFQSMVNPAPQPQRPTSVAPNGLTVVGSPQDMQLNVSSNPQLQALQRTQQPQAQTPDPTSSPMTQPATGGLGRNPDLGNKPMSPQVQQAIAGAAKEFNVPASLMYDIGYSEGGFRPDAKNDSPEGQKVGTPVGLFQFTPGTWNGDLANYAKSSNSSFSNFNPQTPREDPVANARAAAYLISHGQLQRWEASRPNWGRFYSKQELAPYYSQSNGFGNQ